MVRLTWFGQAGFVIETPSARVGIDLFLTDTEGAKKPVAALDALGQLDAVCSTHEHLDHFDAPLLGELALRQSGLRVVVPPPLRGQAEALGFGGRLEEAIVHRPITVGGDITIFPVPSCHGVNMSDAYHLGQPPGQFVGYVIKAGDIVVYHSGDTVIWATMEEDIASYGVDVALLPINGRDPFRESMGIVGNLSAEEAVEVAHRLGARVLVPMHFDAFLANPGSPDAAVRHARQFHPDLTVLVLGYLNPIDLTGHSRQGRI